MQKVPVRSAYCSGRPDDRGVGTTQHVHYEWDLMATGQPPASTWPTTAILCSCRCHNCMLQHLATEANAACAVPNTACTTPTHPAGWISLGEDRASNGAFLFTWPEGDITQPGIKLPKIGGPNLAGGGQLQLA